MAERRERTKADVRVRRLSLGGDCLYMDFPFRCTIENMDRVVGQSKG